MSRPWSNSVWLRLEPGRVRGAVVPGWLQSRLLNATGRAAKRAQTQRAESSVTPSDSTADAVARAVDAVLIELAKTSSLQGSRLEVELANALVHLDVVEGDFAGDSDRQLQSVAVACVAELLGDAAQDHEIRWQLQANKKHLLIGAIARNLLGALSAAAARQGMSLHSVQPDLCLQWNRHAGATSKTSGAAVFAVACGSAAVVTRVADGSIAALSSGNWGDRSTTAGALDQRVDRLLASAGLDPQGMSAFVLVGPKGAEKGVSPRWAVKHWGVQVS